MAVNKILELITSDPRNYGSKYYAPAETVNVEITPKEIIIKTDNNIIKFKKCQLHRDDYKLIFLMLYFQVQLIDSSNFVAPYVDSIKKDIEFYKVNKNELSILYIENYKFDLAHTELMTRKLKN